MFFAQLGKAAKSKASSDPQLRSAARQLPTFPRNEHGNHEFDYDSTSHDTRQRTADADSGIGASFEYDCCEHPFCIDIYRF